MESFKQEKESISPVFFFEMILLAEYSILAIYFCYALLNLFKTKSPSSRSIILNISLLSSTVVRVVLFLPPKVPSNNTVTVIDMFSASACFFTAVSAVSSQWHDVFILSRWCHKFEKKYLLIKRFTLINVLVNIFMWLSFGGIIALAELCYKQKLIK